VATLLKAGVKSVICLLSDEEMEWYEPVPGGLLARYRERGLVVASVPVQPSRQPSLTRQQCAAISEAFATLPKPVVIHCSAGLVRSGDAVRFLKAQSDENQPVS